MYKCVCVREIYGMLYTRNLYLLVFVNLIESQKQDGI